MADKNKKNKNKKEKKSIFEKEINIGRVTLLQKAQFFRYLSVLLRAGITIDEALEIVAEQSTGRFKGILSNILVDVRKGNYLYSALSVYPGVFTEMMISIIRSGEIAGRLPENLSDLNTQLERDYKFRMKLRGAMVYPLVILVGVLGLSSFLAFFILPKIMPLLEGLRVELPLTTRILITVVNTVQTHWLAVLLGSIGVVLMSLFILRSKFTKPLVHYISLQIPILNDFVMKVNLAMFCRILGSLLRSGIHVDQALIITSNVVDNLYYRKILKEVYVKIKKGSKISASLTEHESYFPIILIRMLHVGERTGNLDESLLYLADFYEEEVQNKTEAFVSLLEPVLLLLMGIMVGGVALSIITPIYKITGSVAQ